MKKTHIYLLYERLRVTALREERCEGRNVKVKL